MHNRDYKINSNKPQTRKIVSTLKSPYVYKGSDYGFDKTLTGDGVAIAVIDTGQPAHKDINNIAGVADVTPKGKSPLDADGHATMVCGIIAADDPDAITGIAPKAAIITAKVIDSNNYCSFNNVLAGVLWGIVSEADIILISLGAQTDYPILRDAIAKANEAGILVVAARGNGKKPDYPAGYENVVSVGESDANLVIPKQQFKTTYLNNQYVTASGTSLSAALGAGLAALAIEELRTSGKEASLKEIHERLKRIKA